MGVDLRTDEDRAMNEQQPSADHKRAGHRQQPLVSSALITSGIFCGLRM
jgi:hypothetical protein